MKSRLIYVLLISLLIGMTSSCSIKEKNYTKNAMLEQGIITKKSTQDFESTYQKLKNILENNPNLKIITELDHQANAARVGKTLNPTRIIMFGNPNLGTPLMVNAQSIGLDLPQKILVYQDDDDNVLVSYNNPLYLKERHGVEGNDEVLEKIKGALNMITDKVITK